MSFFGTEVRVFYCYLHYALSKQNFASVFAFHLPLRVFTAWSSCSCVFPAPLHFSVFSFSKWALKTTRVVFIWRTSLWDCWSTCSSWSAVLITNLMVLPSPKFPSTKSFNHSFGLSFVPVPCSQSTSLLVTAAFQLISQPDPLSATFSWLCSLLPLLFPQQCTFLPGVIQVWSMKPT